MNLDSIVNLVRRFSKELLIGAMGALGGSLVTVGAPWLWTYVFGHQIMVGRFVQPPDPEMKNGKCVYKARGPNGIEVASAVQSETWDFVTFRGRLSGEVKGSEGGSETIEGYDIRRASAAPVDTIVAAYRGAEIGRGNYYLHRSYDGPVLKRQWWLGYQVMYDCTTREAVACPYVLGDSTLDGPMSQEPWLKKSCWPVTEGAVIEAATQASGTAADAKKAPSPSSSARK
ncbi:hypothetical protein [Bradyrhizobium sp. CCBAU 21362]|uniref:hypothetical protein n=1 Tax=Bradyrhizobium sp. CCBAU 21362 TaxID=1325082 RepID=UPI0023051764|nr:hypothetical protein [Bradyrhizobium sp. CCBAU 21362]